MKVNYVKLGTDLTTNGSSLIAVKPESIKQLTYVDPSGNCGGEQAVNSLWFLQQWWHDQTNPRIVDQRIDCSDDLTIPDTGFANTPGVFQSNHHSSIDLATDDKRYTVDGQYGVVNSAPGIENTTQLFWKRSDENGDCTLDSNTSSSGVIHKLTS